MSGGNQERVRPLFPFPRSARLLQHAAFDRVYREGRRIFSGNLTVFVRRRQDEIPAEGSRVGFTVSRALGGAVQRNRMKRRLREATRRHLALLTSPVDVVINPKKSLLTAEFTQILDEIERAFNQIRRGNLGTENRSRTEGGKSMSNR